MFLFWNIHDECDEAIYSISKGDRNALSVIYREYGKMIFSVALQIVKQKSDAEDVLQDTMLKILKSAHGYRKGTNPKAWILSITRSCALDRLKKRGNDLPLDAEVRDCSFTEDNVEFIYINEALNKLSHDEQLIIKLRYYADLDHKGIAKVMGISCAAARKRCQRALEKLRSYFEEQEEKK